MPTKTSTVTSALMPAQLMAETLISRGMLYFPSRTTVVVLVVMDCVVVLVSILYSSTTSSSPDSQEMMMKTEIPPVYEDIPLEKTPAIELKTNDAYGPISK